MAYISMRTIAKKVGVSAATVSMALRGQPWVSAAMTEKIQEIAKELGYRPPAVLHEAMGQLRMQKRTGFESQLALCLDMHVEYLNEGHRMRWKSIEERAARFGYSLETFYLPKCTSRALRTTLRSRNIRGVILMSGTWLAPDMEFLIEDFACVFLGHARGLGLPIHFVEADEFQAGKKALQEVIGRGYSRIGLARFHLLDPEGLYRAGIYSTVSNSFSVTTLELHKFGEADKRLFLRWVEETKPDCILTMISNVRPWLEEAGYRFPEDIGLVHLNKSYIDKKDWSGIDPLWDEISGAGVDKLVSMLRQGASGIPPVQECILVEGVWAEGSTLRSTRKQLIYDADPAPLKSTKGEAQTLKCLELRPYMNHSFSRPGAWFGERPLLYCAEGEHKICGTRFRVLDETVDEKTALIMRSRRCPGAENPVEVEIPIGRKVKAIHFLHGCGWSGGPIRNFASYHFIDRQGRSETVQLIDRRNLTEKESNIQDWWPNLGPLTSAEVRPVHLTAYGNREIYSAYLYILEWVNPYPRKTIEKLRITSDPAAETTLGVVAITLVV